VHLREFQVVQLFTYVYLRIGYTIVWSGRPIHECNECMAALFYSPVDFTDASDLHQPVVKFIG